MKSITVRILLLSIGMIGSLGTSVWGQEPHDSTTIYFNMAVHFLAPDGHDVLVQPGTYRVESADNGLQFIPAQGDAQLIGVEVSTHEEELDDPLVVSLAGKVDEYKDIHLVMLLLPGGKSLEAAGSYSGVRERALQLKRIASFKKRTTATIRRAAQSSRQRTAQRPRVARASASAKGGLMAYRLSGLWIHEESVSEVKVAQKSGGKWIWPGVYDVTPKLIHLTWELGAVPESDIPRIISQNGYGLELRLNGRLLKQGPDGTSADFYATPYSPNNEGLPSVCPTSKTCLGTTIQYHQWDSATPPWTVEISYWKQGIRTEALGQSAIRLPGSDQPLVRPNSNIQKTKIVGVIYPNQTTGKSYFTHVLYPIFKHDRCTSCHTLGSKSALVERHNGLITEDIIQEVQGHIGMNFGCGGGCHVYIPEPTQPVEGVIFHDSEWKTPRFDMGIDWRGKSDKYICQKVTSSLPTAEKRRDHFFHDSRIAWAVHSGALPPPKLGTKLPTAPPGDYWKFQNLVELWIRSGAPCPK